VCQPLPNPREIPPVDDGNLLGREWKAAAGSAKHQLFRHLLLGEIDEVLAAAMHRKDVLEIELFEFVHHLAQIIPRRRSQVKTANQRVDLLDAGILLRASKCVDDAGMPARGDDDQPAIA
jgi:hypothetical protein